MLKVEVLKKEVQPCPKTESEISREKIKQLKEEIVHLQQCFSEVKDTADEGLEIAKDCYQRLRQRCM